MKPDGSKLEFVAQFNNNTWGLGFNNAGDVFGSTANRNPSFFCGIPQALFGKEKRMSAKMIASTPSFYPITPNIRQVDAFNQYTAGAGHAFATSANFPPGWQGRSAFVCGPTGNLLGRFQIRDDGAGFHGKNAYNFVASADEWFSPVAAEVGPDGNVWIADWYNFIIQHNPTPNPDRGGFAGETGKGNAHVNPNRDKQHGRIYRVVRTGEKKRETRSLAGASTAELIAALGDSNLFWRQTAQRLLLERNETESAIPLREVVVKKGGPAAIHALWTLEGLGELDKDTHQFALLSKEPALKQNAIRALGTDDAALQLFFDTAVVSGKDPRTRLAAFTKMATFPKTDVISRAATELMKVKENFR